MVKKIFASVTLLVSIIFAEPINNLVIGVQVLQKTANTALEKSLEQKMQQFLQHENFVSATSTEASPLQLVGAWQAEPVEVTSTAPAMYVQKGYLNLYLVDVKQEKKIGFIALKTQGIAKSEELATLDAVKKINIAQEALHSFAGNMRTQAGQLYEKSVPQIFQKAEGLAGQKLFLEAIEELSKIPDFVPEAYAQALTLAASYAQLHIQTRCAQFIAQLEVAWASKNIPQTQGLLALLAQSASADCQAKAAAIAKEVEAYQCQEWLAMAKAAISAKNYAKAAEYLARVNASTLCAPSAKEYASVLEQKLDAKEYQQIMLDMVAFQQTLLTTVTAGMFPWWLLPQPRTKPVGDIIK
jgi:hypothetical protein